MATLLKVLQANIAQRCIGNSAVRGQPSGTLKACRTFFSRLHLDRLPRSNREDFDQWLHHQTSRLRTRLPGKHKPWGIARKTLNLFLRDVVYNRQLYRAYHLRKVHRWSKFLSTASWLNDSVPPRRVTCPHGLT